MVVAAAMLTHPPGLVLNPIGRMRERGGEREEANEGRAEGNKSAWRRESIVSPSFPRYLICRG